METHPWLKSAQFRINNELTCGINETIERSIATTFSTPTTLLIDSSRFSNWFLLVRVTARVIVFVDTLKGYGKHSATMEDLEKAKFLLHQQFQQETFGGTYNQLRTKQQVDNKDKLQQLSPFLESGIIRARGDYETHLHQTLQSIH